MPTDWREAISLRLTSLALGPSGRLSDDVVLGVAVRGALLVDLALRHPGALDGVSEGVGPTGFAPADRLLQDVGTLPAAWLRRGRLDQDDLATEHVRQGSWTRRGSWLRPRYRDQLPERTRRDALLMASSPDRTWEPADAALAAIAGVLGVLETGRSGPTDALRRQTGPARPLVELAVHHIRDSIRAATDSA